MNDQQQVPTSFITNLENARESKVIVYCTGDRQPLGAARIDEDAVKTLYDHLVNLDFEYEKKKIDLHIYSRGGDVQCIVGESPVCYPNSATSSTYFDSR